MAKTAINLSISDIRAKKSGAGFNAPCLLPTTQESIDGAYAWNLRSGNFCSFRVQRTNSPHIHLEGHEICLVLEGTGAYRHGAEEYTLEKGDLFLADPGVVHEISSHKTADLLLAFFVFFAKTADAGPELPLKETDRIIERFLKGHDVLTGAGEDLTDYIRLLSRQGIRSDEGGAFGTETIWKAFAFECLGRLSSIKIQRSKTGKKDITALERATQFIRSNASHPLTVEELAQAVGLSGRQLRRLFKKELGREARDMIADARIQRSLHLLSMSFSVNEVAHMIVESSQAQFCRLFKRRVGITPKDYQKTHAPRRPAEQFTRPSRLK